MGTHLIDGEFQSDKYPTTPRGKVPLSCKDVTAQDLLWEYAQRRRSVDAEFSADLEEALRLAGYVPKSKPKQPSVRFPKMLSVGEIFDLVREAFPENISIYVTRIDPAPHQDFRPIPMASIADSKALLDFIETNLRNYEQLRSVYTVRFREANGSERGRGYYELNTLPETRDLSIRPSGFEWVVCDKRARGNDVWQLASARKLADAVATMRTLQEAL